MSISVSLYLHGPQMTFYCSNSLTCLVVCFSSTLPESLPREALDIFSWSSQQLQCKLTVFKIPDKSWTSVSPTLFSQTHKENKSEEQADFLTIFFHWWLEAGMQVIEVTRQTDSSKRSDSSLNFGRVRHFSDDWVDHCMTTCQEWKDCRTFDSKKHFGNLVLLSTWNLFDHAFCSFHALHLSYNGHWMKSKKMRN